MTAWKLSALIWVADRVTRVATAALIASGFIIMLFAT